MWAHVASLLSFSGGSSLKKRGARGADLATLLCFHLNLELTTNTNLAIERSFKETGFKSQITGGSSPIYSRSIVVKSDISSSVPNSYTKLSCLLPDNIFARASSLSSILTSIQLLAGISNKDSLSSLYS